MSTDYTHFSNLAFTNLFARGPDGAETLIVNSAGVLVGLVIGGSSSLNITGTVTAAKGTFNGVVIGSAANTITHVSTIDPSGALLVKGNTSISGTLTVSSTVGASNFSGTFSGTSSGTNTGDNVAATSSTAGIVSTGTQTFGGTKTIIGELAVTKSSTADVGVSIDNTNATNAAAHADLIARTASGGGDPYARFIATGLTTWSSGLDRSDAGTYKVSNNSTLGSNDYLTITTAGAVSIHGTVTNDAASAGFVGEKVSAFTNTASYTTTAVFQDVASFSLTAGDWEINLFGFFSANGAVSTQAVFGLGTAAASASTGIVFGDNTGSITTQTGATALGNGSVAVPGIPVSIASTTTYYFKTQATYSVGTPQFKGRYSARRMR